MGSGWFISFEGSEGCGKSTQIERLCDWLESSGRELVRLREPGGTPLGESIRGLLQHAPEGEGMSARAELLLFTASRAQLVDKVVKPALARGRVVVCDRFLDSTAVYQGVARRLGRDAVDSINAFAVDGCLPDLTFYLDLPPEDGMRRVLDRSTGARDRIEREQNEFFQRVRAGYLDLASDNPGRVVVVDAAASVDEVAGAIRGIVESRLNGISQATGA